MNISIIIFCYNEGENISPVISSALSLLTEIMEQFEIIIVDDGSTDDTIEICKIIAAQNSRINIVRHAINKGIGMALRSGYEFAKYEYVCAIPGDGQFDVKELIHVKPFSKNIFYSFYRYNAQYSLYRNCLTWVNRLFNQHILGVYLRDVNWIKVYRKEQIELVNPVLRSSLIESEICAKLYKMNVMPIEIPSVYHTRYFGKSKGGSWKTVRKAVAETYKLWRVVVSFKPKE